MVSYGIVKTGTSVDHLITMATSDLIIVRHGNTQFHGPANEGYSHTRWLLGCLGEKIPNLFSNPGIVPSLGNGGFVAI